LSKIGWSIDELRSGQGPSRLGTALFFKGFHLAWFGLILPGAALYHGVNLRNLKKGINYHPQSVWLEFSVIGRKFKSTSVLSTLNLYPGAELPVCFARIN
jgi:hypothetical protein